MSEPDPLAANEQDLADMLNAAFASSPISEDSAQRDKVKRTVAESMSMSEAPPTVFGLYGATRAEIAEMLPKLVHWVEWLIESYAITNKIRKCWPYHGRAVGELYSLWQSYMVYHSPESGGEAPGVWHTNYLSPALPRVFEALHNCKNNGPCRREHSDGPTTRVDVQWWNQITGHATVNFDRDKHWPPGNPIDEAEPSFSAPFHLPPQQNQDES